MICFSSLTKLFHGLKSLKMTFKVNYYCSECLYFEAEKEDAWSMPLTIQYINGHLTLNSIQEYLEWKFQNREDDECIQCGKSKMRVEFEFLSNPEILIVDFLSITKGRFSVPKNSNLMILYIIQETEIAII